MIRFELGLFVICFESFYSIQLVCFHIKTGSFCFGKTPVNIICCKPVLYNCTKFNYFNLLLAKIWWGEPQSNTICKLCVDVIDIVQVIEYMTVLSLCPNLGGFRMCDWNLLLIELVASLLLLQNYLSECLIYTPRSLAMKTKLGSLLVLFERSSTCADSD